MRISSLLISITLLTAASVVHTAAYPVQADAVIGARKGKLYLQDARSNQKDADITVLPDGPIPGVQSFTGTKDGQPFVVKLNTMLKDRGTISFWIKPEEHYRNGEGRSKVRCELIEMPRVGKCYFVQETSACLLGWDWDWTMLKGVGWLGTYIPDLPGPEWYHLVYTWDAEQGLFDAYINGTPQQTPGMTRKPWTMPGGDEVRIHAQGFRIAEITLRDDYLAPEYAAILTPDNYQGKHANLVGVQKEIPPMDVKNRLGKLLYESKLDSKAATDGWVMEGPGIVEYKRGWMEMSSPLVDGTPKGHIVHWCPQDFPDSFAAEWDIQILSDAGFCIVFLAAKGEKGEDIFDPSLPGRDGVFKHYTVGSIVSYHISYCSNSPGIPGRPTSNLRKNNHFYLISNGPCGILPGDKNLHKVTLIKDRNHIQLQVDGKVIIDYTDNGKRYGKPHGDGKIGLRHMEWTKARYRNFKVYELKH